jgi:hypothetical protein
MGKNALVKENLKEIYNLENFGADGRIILK